MSTRDIMTDTQQGAEGLPGVNGMSTRQARLRAALQRAAELEREGGEDAAHCWLIGQALAALESERLWCEARGHCAKKKAGRAPGSNGGR